MKLLSTALAAIVLTASLASVAEARMVRHHHHGMMRSHHTMMKRPMMRGNKNMGATPNKYTNMGH